MSENYKDLSIEELEYKLEECDSKTSDLLKERRTILNTIHEKGGYKELINLVGKYVKVKGSYFWDDRLDASADFFMCKIESISQVQGRDSAYFKVSHYIYVMNGEKIDYEDEKLVVKFFKDDQLDSLEINDISEKCTIITKEEYIAEVNKVKTLISNEFNKLIE